jgi:hypothetical protein
MTEKKKEDEEKAEVMVKMEGGGETRRGDDAN